MKKMTAALLAIFILGIGMAHAAPRQAAPDEIRAITKEAKDQMKDPESVKVRKLVGRAVSSRLLEFCGEINAKNSYGGYAGFKPFIALVGKNNGKIVMVDLSGIDDDPGIIYQLCAEKDLTPR